MILSARFDSISDNQSDGQQTIQTIVQGNYQKNERSISSGKRQHTVIIVQKVFVGFSHRGAGNNERAFCEIGIRRNYAQ